jgi:hypothetical protein
MSDRDLFDAVACKTGEEAQDRREEAGSPSGCLTVTWAC